PLHLLLHHSVPPPDLHSFPTRRSSDLEKIIADATYFPTIGNLKLNPQTGFADWNEDFPNPIDFYGILIAGDAILPTNNQNFSQVDRKSTRLNSSHDQISYAVFCLKKKK